MKKVLSSIFSLAVMVGSCKDKVVSSSDYTQADSHPTIYDFNMKDITGQDVSLSDYKGKTVLIVNVASKCGLTPQYKSLQALYNQYEDKGLVILGFPANNFLSQESGTNEEIQEFCELNYGVTFPMFSKISVKGKDIHPLYQYLTQKSKNGLLDAPVTWNFQKFLINKEGKLVASFNPKTTVEEQSFLEILEDIL